MSIRRYTIEAGGDFARLDEIGKWVRYSDHSAEIARLTARCERLAEEVKAWRNYGDDFKAYVAEDGCRYGLLGAFVRIETTKGDA